jgi:hypothetical protein
MPLTDAERVEVRRHCGYGPAGTLGIGSGLGIMPVRGDLEFRMSNLSPAEQVVLRRYLGALLTLEIAIPKTGEHLDTEQASVWTRNRNEVRDRLRFLDEWRRRLCAFLGVPPGPGLGAGGVALVI